MARRCPAWRRREPDLLLPYATWGAAIETGVSLQLCKPEVYQERLA